MNAVLPRMALVVAAFVVVFVSGYSLTRSGSPYSTALLTAHKLVAVAVLAYTVYAAWAAHAGERGLGAAELAVVVAAVVLFAATIATGGMLSTAGTFPPIVGILHRVGPYLTAAATLLSLYLLATTSS
jgi:hypothetical protein